MSANLEISSNFELAATFMRELADIVRRELAASQLGISEARLAEIGESCAHKACVEFSGHNLYVPCGFAMRIDARDRALHDFFIRSGRNVSATAREFKISMKQVYQRVALIEAAELALRQGTLFDAGA